MQRPSVKQEDEEQQFAMKQKVEDEKGTKRDGADSGDKQLHMKPRNNKIPICTTVLGHRIWGLEPRVLRLGNGFGISEAAPGC